MMRRREALKIDKMTEKKIPPVLLRYANEIEAEAQMLLEILQHAIPVVEAYLDAPLEGLVRFEVLPVGSQYQSGTNAAAGVMRYALKGKEARTPGLAGELSYQFAKILWYRGSSDQNYSAPPPRIPKWLLETVLSPLKFIWFDRDAWQRAFYKRVQLFEHRGFLSLEQLNHPEKLSENDLILAEAQYLLRAQSLSQRFPKWQSDISRKLSINFDLSAEKALEQVTSALLDVWEARFKEDASRWLEYSKQLKQSSG
ncbi:MAG: hypothetical protein R2880_17505 [Deinococcales bacterium]